MHKILTSLVLPAYALLHERGFFRGKGSFLAVSMTRKYGGMIFCLLYNASILREGVKK